MLSAHYTIFSLRIADPFTLKGQQSVVWCLGMTCLISSYRSNVTALTLVPSLSHTMRRMLSLIQGSAAHESRRIWFALGLYVERVTEGFTLHDSSQKKSKQTSLKMSRRSLTDWINQHALHDLSQRECGFRIVAKLGVLTPGPRMRNNQD